MSRRKAVLKDLLSASRPIDAVARELAGFQWDSDQELVTLDKTHITSILNDYIEGRRPASEIQMWAETIEGRDDVGFTGERHAELQTAIFELANPDLGYVLSPLRANGIIERIR